MDLNVDFSLFLFLLILGSGRPAAWNERTQIVIEPQAKSKRLSSQERLTNGFGDHEDSGAPLVSSRGPGLQKGLVDQTSNFTVDTSEAGKQHSLYSFFSVVCFSVSSLFGFALLFVCRFCIGRENTEMMQEIFCIFSHFEMISAVVCSADNCPCLQIFYRNGKKIWY